MLPYVTNPLSRWSGSFLISSTIYSQFLSFITTLVAALYTRLLGGGAYSID